MTANTVLVVDDEPAIRSGIQEFLAKEKYRIIQAGSCADAEAEYRAERPDAAILDYRLPDDDALQLMARLKRIDASTPIIILTAYGTIDLAVRAIKQGAEYFLPKPVQLPALSSILRTCIGSRRNGRAVTPSSPAQFSLNPFVGESLAIRELSQQARIVALTDTPVLIQGETGSGKGVLARWIHENGPRSRHSFVDINCAGISRDLLESELFGHEKGAFTSAASVKVGLLEVAHQGSLFLDEIGDMAVDIQPKLLTAVEEQRFRRLGAVTDRTVDFRLIAATHRSLRALVADGKFRSDLYFRINAFPLRLPPLRERSDDIPALCEAMLNTLRVHQAGHADKLTDGALARLRSYTWPGNLRELRNVLHRCMLVARGDAICEEDICLEFDPPALVANEHVRGTLLDCERTHIERVLRAQDGRVADAARLLGVPVSSLYQKIKRLGIDLRRTPESSQGS